MSRIVAVEARHDIPTRRAFSYRDTHLYATQSAQVAGTFVFARGPLANRTNIASIVAREAPRMLMAVGHGDGDTMMGYSWQPLWEPGLPNAADVTDCIVHLVSCETAQRLGEYLVNQGARAFIGYTEIIMLIDEVFQEFMDCDTAIDLTLLLGGTVRQAHAAAIARFNHHINRFKGEGKLFQAAVMETHRDSLRSPMTDQKFGDPNARL